MKKIWIIILVSLLVVFIVIQFFPPKKNDNITNPQDDIVFQVDMPTAVKKKIVEACYDCHSNKTRYPFYNRIAPVSWIMANHIKEGKEKLNFSEWANYNKKDQLKLLTEICEMITEGEMPLKSYKLMHSSAVLNPDQVEEICLWTEQAGEEVLGRE